MKKVINYLKENGYTFLIYKNEETWVSDGIDPIRAVIKNE